MRVEADRIERVERDGPIFVAYGFEKTGRSRRMILATGVVDEQPELMVWKLRSSEASFAYARFATALKRKIIESPCTVRWNRRCVTQHFYAGSPAS